MALSIAELTALNDLIAHTLERHIEPIFKHGTKVTLLARTPGNNEADVLVSSEGDLQDVLDMVARSMSRNVIGGPLVDIVPRLNPAASEALVEPIAWLYEDTLPDAYPYDEMFPHSAVRGGVRMFPVFAPGESAEAGPSNEKAPAVGVGSPVSAFSTAMEVLTACAQWMRRESAHYSTSEGTGLALDHWAAQLDRAKALVSAQGTTR